MRGYAMDFASDGCQDRLMFQVGSGPRHLIVADQVFARNTISIQCANHLADDPCARDEHEAALVGRLPELP